MAGFTHTPLRYPGGKSRLTAFIDQILTVNNITNGTYIEPFCGGAGIAVNLLMKNKVNRIVLNDKDRSVYAFWHSVLRHTERFIDQILTIPLTVEEWKKQKAVQQEKKQADLFELGFSTFFLNRTNRSGILKAGVIGGLEQTGNYKMDARFNREKLALKVTKIGEHRRQIEICNNDVIDFIDTKLKSQTNENLLAYFDPPYFNKGHQLYMNFFTPKDHAKLAQAITKLDMPWLVSYDDTPEIRSIYSDQKNIKNLFLRYSAGNTNLGKEILYAHHDIILSD